MKSQVVRRQRETSFGLSAQELKFAEHMLLGNSALSSALHIGAKHSSAGTTGTRMCRKPEVLRYMQARKEELQQRSNITIDRVKEEMAKLAFLNVADIVAIEPDGTLRQDFTKATPDHLAAVTSVSTKKRSIYSAKGEHLGDEVTNKVTLADKYRGLELLGRHLGMFKAEEQRVVVDVADRLLAARRRMSIADNTDDEET